MDTLSEVVKQVKATNKDIPGIRDNTEITALYLSDIKPSVKMAVDYLSNLGPFLDTTTAENLELNGNADEMLEELRKLNEHSVELFRLLKPNYDDLEKDRERANQRTPRAPFISTGSGDNASDESNGMLAGIGIPFLAGAEGLAAIAGGSAGLTKFAKGATTSANLGKFLKGGVVSAIGYYAGEQIGDFTRAVTGKEESVAADILEYSVKGASLGSMLGPGGAFVGALAGLGIAGVFAVEDYITVRTDELTEEIRAKMDEQTEKFLASGDLAKAAAVAAATGRSAEEVIKSMPAEVMADPIARSNLSSQLLSADLDSGTDEETALANFATNSIPGIIDKVTKYRPELLEDPERLQSFVKTALVDKWASENRSSLSDVGRQDEILSAVVAKNVVPSITNTPPVIVKPTATRAVAENHINAYNKMKTQESAAIVNAPNNSVINNTTNNNAGGSSGGSSGVSTVDVWDLSRD